MVRYDWKKFRKDSDLQQSYTVEVHNQFSILCSMEEEVNMPADKKYPLFLEAHKQAASKTLPKKEKRQRNKASWEDDAVTQARNQLRDAYKQFSESSNDRDKNLLEKAKVSLDCTYGQVEEKYIKEKISIIQSASQSMQSGLAWTTMNEITGRKAPTSGRLYEGEHLPKGVQNGKIISPLSLVHLQ